jgi:hypothetical protein
MGAPQEQGYRNEKDDNWNALPLAHPMGKDQTVGKSVGTEAVKSDGNVDQVNGGLLENWRVDNGANVRCTGVNP